MEADGFQYSLGPPNSGFSLFQSSRCKKIHFIRHAEGFHNVATATTGNTDCLRVETGGDATEHEFYDARLTQKVRREA